MTRRLSAQDWTVLGGGVAAFVASLLPFVGVSYTSVVGVTVPAASASVNAWHSYATIGVLLILAAAGLWAVRLLTTIRLPALAIGWSTATAITASLGAGLAAIRAFTWTGNGVSVSYGGWALIAAGVTVTAGAAWKARSDAADRPATPISAPPAPPTPTAAVSTPPGSPAPTPTPPPVPPPSSTAATTGTVAERLAQLDQLRAAAAITEEEHHQLRQRILNQL